MRGARQLQGIRRSQLGALRFGKGLAQHSPYCELQDDKKKYILEQASLKRDAHF